jgi:hypothetical protein
MALSRVVANDCHAAGGVDRVSPLACAAFAWSKEQVRAGTGIGRGRPQEILGERKLSVIERVPEEEEAPGTCERPNRLTERFVLKSAVVRALREHEVVGILLGPVHVEDMNYTRRRR